MSVTCVAFCNPECSKTGQKKRCWKVHVKLVWCGQINLPWGVRVDCREVKMTAEMEQKRRSKYNRRCTERQLVWDCSWQTACYGIVSSEIVVPSFRRRWSQKISPKRQHMCHVILGRFP